MGENQKELQKMYLELQFLDEQMKQIQKQITMLDEQLVELNNTIQALDDFNKTAVGTKILVSLSPGIFTTAELKDNKELLVNVGGNIVVKKNVAETKDLLKKRFDSIKKYRDLTLAEMQKMGLQASNIEQEINKIIEKKE
ncbi:prefoldin subunit alpha [Candidatus Woesearchaeota archaeon CG1_02_33_12]|nr:MAG: prefoldin subunit alpha [Candidatus Woesearchaeota archaeon CG1_02_33_12]PIN77567.1 MAG: prefoldin subunit alpha [Candidatus Woesearchaeota archaeon CG10_big_fil_rev_8_21_14_0_10_33_12]PIU72335.1 MAG: prefoldin subunit alpha [Candidatus Woesearchaeota archaeon CG06_land_8_20_14_3_00_33_13]